MAALTTERTPHQQKLAEDFEARFTSGEITDFSGERSKLVTEIMELRVLRGVMSDDVKFIATYYPEKSEDPTVDRVLQIEVLNPHTLIVQKTRQQTSGMPAQVKLIFEAFEKQLSKT